MLKLVICLITGALISVCVLQLRQQNMQLGHQCNQLHDKIRGRQSKLWSQQLEIAMYTAPNAINQTVATHELNLVPQTPPPAGKAHWIDVSMSRKSRSKFGKSKVKGGRRAVSSTFDF